MSTRRNKKAPRPRYDVDRVMREQRERIAALEHGLRVVDAQVGRTGAKYRLSLRLLHETRLDLQRTEVARQVAVHREMRAAARCEELDESLCEMRDDIEQRRRVTITLAQTARRITDRAEASEAEARRLKESLSRCDAYERQLTAALEHERSNVVMLTKEIERLKEEAGR